MCEKFVTVSFPSFSVELRRLHMQFIKRQYSYEDFASATMFASLSASYTTATERIGAWIHESMLSLQKKGKEMLVKFMAISHRLECL